MRAIWLAAGGAGLAAGPARAHVAEQGFVLLLPTGVYTAAGVATVAATVLVLTLLPAGAVARAFRPLRLPWPRLAPLRGLSLWLAFALFWFLVWAGLNGPRDPLTNPLPLAVWTLGWIALVSLQGLLGDLWRWLSPWRAPGEILRGVAGPGWRYPARLGHWPAVAGFLCFAGFLLADPAPADPARLAGVVAGYWGVAVAGQVAFGRRWLVRAEFVTVVMRSYARIAVFGRGSVGLPGWNTLRRGAVRAGQAVLILCLLGVGSFDGLNETFWWFARLGINPLEFPGRSAVVLPTLAGMLAGSALLIAAFAAAVWLGLRLAGGGAGFGPAFRAFAPSILPIALGYHVAHYLTAFLVDVQYALAAVSDPLARGDDLLGLGTYYVTTGFFATPGTVRIIWLSQAGAVVAGHVLAIVLAHGLAVRLLGDRRRAVLSQAPLAVFMVLYTLFGLWLLASPRGA